MINLRHKRIAPLWLALALFVLAVAVWTFTPSQKGACIIHIVNSESECQPLWSKASCDLEPESCRVSTEWIPTSDPYQECLDRGFEPPPGSSWYNLPLTRPMRPVTF